MPNNSDERLDLNLLTIFDAVMAENSVKQAAARLNMNAPAVSQALGRLREAIGAELFIRAGHGLRPTPRAIQMWPGVRNALGLIKSVVSDSGAFDPMTAKSTVLLDLPPGTDALVTPKLAMRVANAPGLQFRISSARAINVLNDLRFGDSWIACDYRPVIEPGYRCEQVTEQDLVLVTRSQHPALVHGLTAELYQSLPQVVVAAVRVPTVLPVNERLEALGMKRVIRFTVPGLLSMLQMLATLDLVATLPLCTARYMQTWADVQVYELPFDLPKVQFYMVWHERFDTDPAHMWVRRNIAEICAEL